MMKQVSLICFLFTLLLTGCTDQLEIDPALSTTSFWKQSHTKRLGLQGSVRELNEYSESGDERIFRSQMQFDALGHITHYTPVQQDGQHQTAPHWLPTPTFSFEYFYSGDRLTKIRVIETGNAPVDYEITYGDSPRYTSLEFLNLKPLAQIYLQGVAEISASDGSVSFVESAEGITLENQVNDVTMTYQYSYAGELLPQSGLQTVSVTGDSAYATQVQSDYTYSDQGAIRQIRVTTREGERISREVYSYNPKGQLLSACLQNELGESTKTYRYNTGDLLLDIAHQDSNGSEIGRMRAIYDLDPYRNWTRAEQRVTGFLDWDMREGTYILIRDIVY